MRIGFFIFTFRHPVGGTKVVYELANAMRRRDHEVHIVHMWMGPGRPSDPSEIGWATFEDGIHHLLPNDDDPFEWPELDFVCAPSSIAPAGALSFNLIQHYRLWGSPAAEDEMIRAPQPKVCVARWLVELVRGMGVADHQIAYVPNGLDHSKYRVTRPLEGRPAMVSMLYRANPPKGAPEGLAALAKVKRLRPDTDVVVFSQTEPDHDIPDGIRFVVNPPQDVLVDEIYNQSRVFLCSSRREGFGLMCIEAMACGAALVTTSNGGSDDYAIHDQTALVCEPRDVTAMADHIDTLLGDDDLRLRIATAGIQYVQRFNWDTAAAKLETYLRGYAADPVAHQQPAGDLTRVSGTP